jgi:hypothetical protein
MRPVDEMDLRLIGVVVSRGGAVIDTGAGAAALGNPARCVAWLANKLGSLGAGLRAGDVVLPGAVHRMVPVQPGDVFRGEFCGLGAVTARFSAMTTELDDVDRRLVHRLAEELPLDLTAVAREVGTTPDDAHQRLLRLRGAGVVRECVAQIDPAAVGLGCTAFLLVRVAQNAAQLRVDPADPRRSRSRRGGARRGRRLRLAAQGPHGLAGRPAGGGHRQAVAGARVHPGPDVHRAGHRLRLRQRRPRTTGRAVTWTGVDEARARENHGAAQHRLAQGRWR